mgnify:CR=1 FL=1
MLTAGRPSCKRWLRRARRAECGPQVSWATRTQRRPALYTRQCGECSVKCADAWGAVEEKRNVHPGEQRVSTPAAAAPLRVALWRGWGATPRPYTCAVSPPTSNATRRSRGDWYSSSEAGARHDVSQPRGTERFRVRPGDRTRTRARARLCLCLAWRWRHCCRCFRAVRVSSFLGGVHLPASTAAAAAAAEGCSTWSRAVGTSPLGAGYRMCSMPSVVGSWNMSDDMGGMRPSLFPTVAWISSPAPIPCSHGCASAWSTVKR